MAEPLGIKPPASNPIGEGIAVPSASSAPVEDLTGKYLLAVKTKDPVAIAEVASQAAGTPLGERASEAKNILQKNINSTNEIAKSVQAAGGLGTPGGNLEAAKQWQTRKDDPQYGRVFAAILLKEPNAYKYLHGGQTKTELTYGNNGHTIKVVSDELGDVHSAVDLNTGAALSPQQFAELQVAQSLGKELTLEKQKKKAAFDTEYLNAEHKMVAGLEGFAERSKTFAEQKKKFAYNMATNELTANDVAQLVGYQSFQKSMKEAASSASSKLGSLSKGESTSFSKEEADSLRLALGPEKFNVSGQGKLTKKNGEDFSKQELDQLQNSFNNSITKEDAFAGTAEQQALSRRFRGMSRGQQDQLLAMADLETQYAKDFKDIKEKYGVLPFMADTGAFDAIRTSANQAEAQAETILHNADMIQKFAAFRRKQLELYDPLGQVPTAGDMLSAFVRSNEFKNSTKESREKVFDIMKREVLMRPEEGAPAAVVPAVPVTKPAAKAPPQKRPSPDQIFKNVLGGK